MWRFKVLKSYKRKSFTVQYGIINLFGQDEEFVIYKNN